MRLPSLSRRNDVHDATPALGAELDVAADEGEQGVVTATPDTGAGVEVGATLTDDDLAGVHQLAAVTLHAEALGFESRPFLVDAAPFLCAMSLQSLFS